MDLGTQRRSTAALLSRVGDHIVTGPQGAATITEGYLDTGVPIAGAGAPLVSEFACWSSSSANAAGFVDRNLYAGVGSAYSASSSWAVAMRTISDADCSTLQ